MFLIDRILLVGAVLLLLAVISSKFSSRVGVPVLVVFLLLGMLAGSEGIGGVAFENYELAHAIGTVALGMILFDGGLRTPMESFRVAWKPSAALATVGVLGTSIITGLAAAWILGISPLKGILLGSIAGSTDAAAVFGLLRNAGVKLRERVAATLEIESGSNDPMAIFLTVGLLEVLLGRMEIGPGMLLFFLQQMGLGALIGLGVGWGAVRLINGINLEAAGLYPVLTGAAGMLAFGLAASVGGSGFLAVYLAAIVLGNSRLVFQRGTLLFHDALAWTGQIVMFVVLGLLSFPSALLEVAPEGILIAAVLILIARPLSVIPLLLPFGYRWREALLISWVGLKGAVPIILATFPLLFGLPDGLLLFNVVFFVVLVSAVTQGWTLPIVARRLGLVEAPEPGPAVTLEITSLRDVEADIVEYSVTAPTRAAGHRLSQLALPDGAVVAMIARAGALVPPRGSTRIEPGDHVFVVLHPGTRPLVDRVFSHGASDEVALPPLVEFPLMGATTADELLEFYGIHLQVPGEQTLDEVIRERIGPELRPGSTLTLDGVTLRVRELVDGNVVSVGLAIPAPGLGP